MTHQEIDIIRSFLSAALTKSSLDDEYYLYMTKHSLKMLDELLDTLEDEEDEEDQKEESN